MKKDYLNFSRASDFQNPKEKILYRCFEILPGFLSWGTLITAFILSWLAPIVVAIFIIAFDFLWLLRISYLSFHQLASYRQMKKNLKTDWIKKLESLKTKNWKNIYHLIIFPMYKEGIEIVKPTIQSLVDSNYPKEKMIVVLATEERAGKVAQKIAKQIQNEFGKTFFRFLITVHPKDIPGEIAGKGSNQSWAVKEAKKLIIDRAPQQRGEGREKDKALFDFRAPRSERRDKSLLYLHSARSRSVGEGGKENEVLFENKLSIPSENIIVSGFDIDARPYPQYFTCLTWHYLTAEKPLRSSYQPIPVYNNNIWQAPSFSRVIATSGTFWQMMQQERQEQLVTYSAHSMPFKIYEEVGYPANIVADDSHIFWKSYLYYNGDYRVIPLYYPISMDAVLAKNLLRTAINQYKQQRRWAWGCVEIPYLLYGFLKNKKIPLKEKLRHTLIIFDGFWSWAVAALLIFFLGWLPLMIGGQEFQVTLLSYNLPRLTSYIMTLAMVGMVASAITSMLLLPPRPKNYSRWKNLSMVLQWFLLPVTLIVFGAFPSLDAQTRLLLGKYLGFWPTEKVKK